MISPSNETNSVTFHFCKTATLSLITLVLATITTLKWKDWTIPIKATCISVASFSGLMTIYRICCQRMNLQPPKTVATFSQENRDEALLKKAKDRENALEQLNTKHQESLAL